MSFSEKVPLGSTGLMVSRIGLGSSFAAPEASYVEAFERGVNYFYWGSLRRGEMGAALETLAPKHRDDLVVCLQSYSRIGWLTKRSIVGALKSLKIDYADVLLLGWFNSPPPKRIRDAALDLKHKGLVRHVAVSSHNRSLFPRLLDDSEYDIWHVRYNAAHRGAEREVFPSVEPRARTERPGIVSYTNTRWGHLCDSKRVPEGERTPTGTDCYRFSLSHPQVDVAIAGPDNADHMRQALETLELGPMSEEELAWMRRVGDHVYGRDVTSGLRDGASAPA